MLNDLEEDVGFNQLQLSIRGNKDTRCTLVGTTKMGTAHNVLKELHIY